jgi:hypothetical protein
MGSPSQRRLRATGRVGPKELERFARAFLKRYRDLVEDEGPQRPARMRRGERGHAPSNVRPASRREISSS